MIKEKIEPVTYNWRWRTGPSDPWTNVTTSFTGRRDYISYGVGRRHPNACNHLVYRGNFRQATYEVNIAPNDRYENVPPLNESCRWPDAYDPFPPPAGFIGRSYAEMKPKFESPTSILNFVYELRDIRRVFTSAQQAVIALRKLNVKDAASALHLNYSFGVKPLIGDIIALSGVLEKYFKDLERFERNLNQPVTSHYSETFTIPGYTRTANGTYNQWKIVVKDCDCKLTATMRYRYRLRPGVALPRGLSSLPAYMGVRWNPKFLWDAVPFSFMLDWILKVGDWLDTFGADVIPVDVEVLSYCLSAKYTRVGALSVGDNGSGKIVPNLNPLGESSVTQYKRRPYLPYEVQSAIVLPRMDGLDVRELVLAASLSNEFAKR